MRRRAVSDVGCPRQRFRYAKQVCRWRASFVDFAQVVSNPSCRPRQTGRAALVAQQRQEEIVMRLISALTGIAFVTSIAMASSAFAQTRLHQDRATVAVRQGRSDRCHQSYHAGRDEGRGSGDQGRQGHQPDQPARRRRAAVRLPLHQDGADGGRSRAGSGARQERSDLHGRHLAQPEPRRHTPRWHGTHWKRRLLLQPDSHGKEHQPEQHDQARARAPEELRHARCVHRPGQGLSAGEQAEDQSQLPHAVHRQGNGHHRGRSAGRPEIDEHDAARGRCRDPSYRLGRPLPAASRQEHRVQQRRSRASARLPRNG